MSRSRHRRGRRQPNAARTLLIWAAATAIVLIAVAAGLLAWQKRSSLSHATAMLNVGDDRQAIFVLGDSFTENPHFQDQFSRAMAGRTVVFDGVGGSTLEQELQRFKRRATAWKSLLVIMDGGLDDADPQRAVGDIVGLLDPGCRRWLYVEPPHSAGNGAVGTPAYAQQTAAVALVRKRWPDHFVPLIDPLRRAGNQTADDRASIAAGWTPSSLRGDPIHLNAAGNAVLVAAVTAAIARLERQEPTPCLGATSQQLRASLEAQ